MNYGLNKKQAEKQAYEYLNDAVFTLNDAFSWMFKAKQYDKAYIIFDTLERLKIALYDVSEESEGDAKEMLKEADKKIKYVLDMISKKGSE